jgi:tetratricopeptide (TPR) repeat protein
VKLLATTTRRAKTLLAAVLLLSLDACASLRNRSPVDEDMAYARRLTQQGVDESLHGNWAHAEQQFRDALRRCPENCEAREKLAECLWKRGEAKQAIGEMTQAIQLSGGHDVSMLVALGEMYFQTGQVDEAGRLADRAIELDSQNPRAFKLSGAVEQRRGNLAGALATFHRALAYAPNDAELRLATAQVYYQLDRPLRTLASLDRIDELEAARPLSIRALHLQGLALIGLQRHHEAVDALLAAHTMCDTPSADILIDLASAQMKAGQYSDAQLTIQQAWQHARGNQQRVIRDLMTQIARRGQDEDLVAR